MKRSILFLFIILALNYVKNEEVEIIDIIYDYIPKVLVGMSKTNSRECSDVFINNKDKILKIIKEYMNSIENGNDWFVIKAKIALELLTINNMIKCNPEKLLELYLKINRIEGYKQIGSSVIKNNLSIYQLIREIKDVEGFDNKMASFGKILSLILDFYVS